jgi:CheY-like chemotaxis protein
MAIVPVILCVDDDEDDLLFVKEAIASSGQSFHIQDAKNGCEALDYLDDCLQKKALPCLIIMDINMPRLDGRETIRMIRNMDSLAKIPIAIFTTSSTSADRNYFEGQGVYFITKPFDYGVFKKEIVDLLAFCAALNP